MISIITLNVNKLNAPIKRHGWKRTEWIRKHDPYLSARDPPQNKSFTQAESEGIEKIFHANGDKKKGWNSNTNI